eukprot:7086427-Pyramimonas_sp.AAC.3
MGTVLHRTRAVSVRCRKTPPCANASVNLLRLLIHNPRDKLCSLVIYIARSVVSICRGPHLMHALGPLQLKSPLR